MQNLIAGIITGIANQAGKTSPFLKAIVPSVAGLVGALVNMALAGSFDATSVGVLVGGVITAAITYLVPNKTQATPAPAPVVVPVPVPVVDPVTPPSPAPVVPPVRKL